MLIAARDNTLVLPVSSAIVLLFASGYPCVRGLSLVVFMQTAFLHAGSVLGRTVGSEREEIEPTSLGSISINNSNSLISMGGGMRCDAEAPRYRDIRTSLPANVKATLNVLRDLHVFPSDILTTFREPDHRESLKDATYPDCYYSVIISHSCAHKKVCSSQTIFGKK